MGYGEESMHAESWEIDLPNLKSYFSVTSSSDRETCVPVGETLQGVIGGGEYEMIFTKTITFMHMDKCLDLPPFYI